MTVIGWMTAAILFRAVALELSSEEATKKHRTKVVSFSLRISVVFKFFFGWCLYFMF